MTTGGPRKSMEDVLAAIRRIVRNEKPVETSPAMGPQVDDDDDDDAPLTLTPAMRSDTGAAMMAEPAPSPMQMAPMTAPMAVAEPAPMATMAGAEAPSMRTILQPAMPEAAMMPPPAAPELSMPEAPQIAMPEVPQTPMAGWSAPETRAPEPAPREQAGGMGSFAAMARPAPAMPAAAVQPVDTVEDAVVIDEAALEDMVRRIVRDELMGEMGLRMSKNVTRLIQDEVARQMSLRG